MKAVAVLFDLDGTIVHLDHYRAIHDAIMFVSQECSSEIVGAELLSGEVYRRAREHIKNGRYNRRDARARPPRSLDRDQNTELLCKSSLLNDLDSREYRVGKLGLKSLRA